MVDYKLLDEKANEHKRTKNSIIAGKTCLWALIIMCFLLAIAIFSYDLLRFKIRHDELSDSKTNKIIDTIIPDTNLIDKNEISQIINGNNQNEDDDDDDDEYDLEASLQDNDENDDDEEQEVENFIQDEIKKFDENQKNDDTQLINDQGDQVKSETNEAQILSDDGTNDDDDDKDENIVTQQEGEEPKLIQK